MPLIDVTYPAGAIDDATREQYGDGESALRLDSTIQPPLPFSLSRLASA